MPGRKRLHCRIGFHPNTIEERDVDTTMLALNAINMPITRVKCADCGKTVRTERAPGFF